MKKGIGSFLLPLIILLILIVVIGYSYFSSYGKLFYLNGGGGGGTSSPSFYLSLTSPTRQITSPSTSTSYTVNVVSLSGFRGNVYLATDGCVSFSCSFSTNPVYVPSASSASSVLSVSVRSDTKLGTYSINILGVSGSIGASRTAYLYYVEPLTITTPGLLPDAYIGKYYSFNLAATGGTKPYTWTLTLKSLERGLPPGMNFYSSGVLAGTPTGGGIYWFTVTVRDRSPNQLSASKTFSISVPY